MRKDPKNITNWQPYENSLFLNECNKHETDRPSIVRPFTQFPQTLGLRTFDFFLHQFTLLHQI